MPGGNIRLFLHRSVHPSIPPTPSLHSCLFSTSQSPFLQHSHYLGECFEEVPAKLLRLCRKEFASHKFGSSAHSTDSTHSISLLTALNSSRHFFFICLSNPPLQVMRILSTDSSRLNSSVHCMTSASCL
ncbi:hypothetical protein TcWFU_004950 [Taenia crassiceps]|uniref:Uncharacterized protein n=1 Tax=Taenia crassiceps TaxID=6207 RepID=A0ABR4Q0A0_9CEST